MKQNIIILRMNARGRLKKYRVSYYGDGAKVSRMKLSGTDLH